MTYHFQNPSDAIVKHYLKNSQVIAVVGLSDRVETVSNRVSMEMQKRGYRIVPVNPRAAGGRILGEIFRFQWTLSMFTVAASFYRM